MLQHVGHRRSALNIIIGVILLLMTTAALIGAAAEAEAAAWTGSHGQLHPQRGCLRARLCCPGKNSTCRVQEPRNYGGSRSRTCYCDTACFSTNDCCADLQLACNISMLCATVIVLYCYMPAKHS